MVRNSARLLAPLALAAVALGIYLIIHSNVSPATSSAHTTSSIVHPRRHASQHGKATARSTSTPTFYTVKSGDTLGAISTRTHVSIERLAVLNPSLKPPYNLQTGQRLRLRR